MLPRTWSLFLLALLAGTWSLWLTVPGEGTMPLVPLLGQPSGWWIPWAALLVSLMTIVLLLAIAIAPARFRPLWWLVAVALALSFLLDQHRLQPWAYQSAIYALVFASMDRDQTRRWLIPMAASVYLYSAAGKFDFQFVNTVGQDFLEAVAQPLGGLPEAWSQARRAKLALGLPAVELLCGIGLLARPTRRASAVVIMGMHATLFAILGPWGLQHSYGVLLWNLLLIAQAYLLLWRLPDSAEPVETQPATGAGARLAMGIVLVALAAPLLERRGYWDHWTSWSLYSPHTSRAVIELHHSAADSLSPQIRTFLEEDSDGDGWSTLALDRWSLESRGVPIYPQGRYQLSLAASLASAHGWDDSLRARLRGCSDRWTGKRDEQRLLGRAEIQRALHSEFWLPRLGSGG